jgi:putative transposase
LDQALWEDELGKGLGHAEEEVQCGAGRGAASSDRSIDIAGKAAPIACRETGISQQSYYRWRKEYGGLELDQAKRMKELERENVRLKRLVADLSLEKQVLKDVVSGNL